MPKDDKDTGEKWGIIIFHLDSIQPSSDEGSRKLSREGRAKLGKYNIYILDVESILVPLLSDHG